ncbi:MAG: hypothetical protein JOY61_03220 [Chloroflexi bacterium]|nr:hypothetical protein [Chloroflexota bacterium]
MAWRSWVSRGALVAVLSSASGLLAAHAQSTCPDAISPELAAELTDLQEAVGSAMGSPTGCPHLDPQGNAVQITSTGVAIARGDGMSVFASGDHHWALTRDGMETWDGSWHNGLYPPVTPAPHQDGLETAPPAVASVEPATVVYTPPDAIDRVVVQTADGEQLIIETATDCYGLADALGQQIFIRSGDAAPETDLIMLQPYQVCTVSRMGASAAY